MNSTTLKISTVHQSLQAFLLIKSSIYKKITGCIVDGIDYYGKDLKQISDIPSASACACACRQQTGCSVFTWKDYTKVCYLKTSDKGRQRSNGTYSGTLQCCAEVFQFSNILLKGKFYIVMHTFFYIRDHSSINPTSYGILESRYLTGGGASEAPPKISRKESSLTPCCYIAFVCLYI